MDRKEAIKRTAAMMGGVIFAPSILGVLNGCTATGDSWEPVLFDRIQVQLTKALSDTIIPETDTPGADKAGVPGFIEKMVNEAYSEEQKTAFLEDLNNFNSACKNATGKSFYNLSTQEKLSYATEMNRDALSYGYTTTPHFFLQFKELTMIGYFTSEIGATQVLRYEPVPGFYNGCLPFEDVGRAWAT